MRKQFRDSLGILFGKFFKSTVNPTGKILDDKILFDSIRLVKPGKTSTDRGEIDIYLAVFSTGPWRVYNTPANLFVVDGSFEDTVTSLNKITFTSTRTSPTTDSFNDSFSAYSILEATTGTRK